MPLAEQPDLISLFVAPLNRLHLTYMVTGSLAAGTYGEPRLTNDVDIVLALSQSDAARLHVAFDNATFYAPPMEVIEAERRRAQYGHFNLIHSGSAFKADVYLVGDDPLDSWALDHRLSVTVSNERVYLAPPEYVIIRKLQYFSAGGSEKHIADTRAMIAVLGERLDTIALMDQIDRLGLRREWARIKSG